MSRRFAAEAANYATFRDTVLSTRVPVPVVTLQAMAGLQHVASARLPTITAPTLVVHGDEDEMLLPDNGELIARQIPGARLEIWEGVGHLFWWEQPERTAALLREHALDRE